MERITAERNAAVARLQEAESAARGWMARAAELQRSADEAVRERDAERAKKITLGSVASELPLKFSYLAPAGFGGGIQRKETVLLRPAWMQFSVFEKLAAENNLQPDTEVELGDNVSEIMALAANGYAGLRHGQPRDGRQFPDESAQQYAKLRAAVAQARLLGLKANSDIYTSLSMCVNSIAAYMARTWREFLLNAWIKAGAQFRPRTSHEEPVRSMKKMLKIALLAPSETGAPLDLANEEQVKEFLHSTPPPGTEAAELKELFFSAPIMDAEVE